MGNIIKLNVDVSINKTPPFAGLGIVARDCNGKVIAWRRRRIPFIQNPELGEALAVRHLAVDLQLQQVCIESDYETLVKALRSSGWNLSPAGVIVEEINSLLHLFTSISFQFIGRTGNSLAHNHARNVLLDSDGVNNCPFS